MGLITKEVEIKTNMRNCKYYENLGYKLPHKPNGKIDMGKSFKVKIQDLTKGSHVQVDVKCDNCQTIKTMQYNTFNMCDHFGKYYCRKCANKIFNSGENHHNWDSSKTQDERINRRNYPEYKDFIKRVMARNNYTCQCCEKTSKDVILEVHHLDGYDWCKEKRTDDTNGITLCHNCHCNFHSIYGRGDNTKEQFEEWIGFSMQILSYHKELPVAKRVYCFNNDTLYDSVNQVCEELNIEKTMVYDVCNHIANHTHGYHFVWEYEYKNMSDDNIELLKNREDTYNHQIICLTTSKIFGSIRKGSEHYNNIERRNISKCCKGLREYAGKLPDDTPLKWMYYSEFTQLTEEEQNNLLNLHKEE